VLRKENQPKANSNTVKITRDVRESMRVKKTGPASAGEPVIAANATLLSYRASRTRSHVSKGADPQRVLCCAA